MIPEISRRLRRPLHGSIDFSPKTIRRRSSWYSISMLSGPDLRHCGRLCPRRQPTTPKAHPAPEIVTALAVLGAHFDLASRGEMDVCFGLDIPSERLSFGNTIKRGSAVAQASSDGIELFAFDSAAELENLARSASGARVFCRMLIANKGAEWP
jgi:hypothetical protein